MGKNLDEMTTEELGKLFPIWLEEYNPEWLNLFIKEKDTLRNEIGKQKILDIEHIGSTSIPGLRAKPIIDIMLVVPLDADLNDIAGSIKGLGYQLNYRKDKPAPHMTFVKGYTPQGFSGQAYHLHIRYPGDRDEIYFRDYLIEHPEVALEYEKLKFTLKDQFEFNREAYTDGKTDFCKRIIRLAKMQDNEMFALE